MAACEGGAVNVSRRFRKSKKKAVSGGIANGLAPLGVWNVFGGQPSIQIIGGYSRHLEGFYGP